MEMGQNWAQGIVIVIVGSLYPLQNLQKELFLVLQAITGRVFCPVKAVCMCFYCLFICLYVERTCRWDQCELMYIVIIFKT